MQFWGCTENVYAVQRAPNSCRARGNSSSQRPTPLILVAGWVVSYIVSPTRGGQ